MPGSRQQAVHDHWIDGGPFPTSGGEQLRTTDPTTRAPGAAVARGGGEEVDRAVAAARAAQPHWARRSASERAAVLHELADAMTRDSALLIELERSCTGKVPSQLQLELDMSVAYLRYYAGAVRALSGRTIDQGALNHTYTKLEPYGVVGVITPWNLPLNQACRAVAPALAVGNAVVIKPSEITPLSTLHLARLATQAGLPAGVLNVVVGTGSEVGVPLVRHPDVRRIAFTGSVATGRQLAATAGDRLIPVTLELGGKSAMVVFADADLSAAVSAAVSAISFNGGQACSATSRLLVERSVHDAFVARVVEAVGRLRPGVDFGPLITEAQFEAVLAHLSNARADGLRPVVGGGTYVDGPAAQGRYVQPTVFADVPPEARIAREEVFGPVLVTLPFDDEEDAVSRANDSEYGLVAAVWSGDLARGVRVAERIDAGQIAVNGGRVSVETPFGGYKQSGYGREKGLEALHEYAQVKTVSIALT